jgi:hypothetical protein
MDRTFNAFQEANFPAGFNPASLMLKNTGQENPIPEAGINETDAEKEPTVVVGFRVTVSENERLNKLFPKRTQKSDFLRSILLRELPNAEREYLLYEEFKKKRERGEV